MQTEAHSFSFDWFETDSGNYKLHSTNCIPEAVHPCNYMLAEEESDTSVEDVLVKKIKLSIFYFILFYFLNQCIRY